MILRSAALSDIGKVRDSNQDRFVCDDLLGLYGVADGIGGLPGGAEAAQSSLDTVRQLVQQADSSRHLADITIAANTAVLKLGHTLSPRHGIGTTLTWGLFRQRRLYLSHVGDTRCYALRHGLAVCLTRDHSWENELKAMNDSKSVSYGTQNPHALTRCIGQAGPFEADHFTRNVVAGDRYLFCSDGVCRGMPEDELIEILREGSDPQRMVEGLVAAANQHGGGDNSTAVAICVDALD